MLNLSGLVVEEAIMDNFTDDKKYKTHLKPILGMIFLLAILFITCLSNVSGAEWDNTLSYDSATKTATLKNWYGLTTIAEVQLKSNLIEYVSRGYQKVAEFEIKSSSDYENFIGGFELYDRKSGWTRTERQIDIKYKTTKTIETQTWKQVCENGSFDSKNGTYEQNCYDVKDKIISEEVIDWLPFDKSILDKQTVTIGLFTEVRKGDIIEWIPSFAGQKVTQWATWTESLNVGLVAVYNMSSNLESVFGDERNLRDGKNVTNFVSFGKYGGSLHIPAGSKSSKNINVTQQSVFGWNNTNEKDKTLCLWYWVNATSSGQQVFVDNGWANGYTLALSNGKMYEQYLSTTPLSLTSTETVGTNIWNHVCLTRNATSTCVWMNGTATVMCGTYRNPAAPTNGIIIGQGYDYTNDAFNGYIDEMYWWNRTLSPSEITDLYADTFYADLTKVFTMTLNSPPNANITLTNTITFNCSAVSTIFNITNVSLWGNWSGTWHKNETITGLNTNRTSQTFTKSIPEGIYNWNCQAGNLDGNTTFASANRTFSIDQTNPIITITSPTGSQGSKIVPYTLPLNYTASDLNLDSCWYNTSYNATVTSLTSCANVTFNVSSALLSNTIWVYANDSVGNIGYNSSTWTVNSLVNSVTYNVTAYESSNESFAINLTLNSSENTIVNSYIYYDNTAYSSAVLGTGDNVVFSNSVVIPIVATSGTNKTFFWSYNILNSTGTFNVNTTQLNQTVLKGSTITASTVCPAGYSAALNFTSYFEQNLSLTNFTTVHYYVSYGLSGNNSAFYINNTLTNIPSFAICINNSQAYYDIGYGEIQYIADSSVTRRYYIFENERITNQTVNIPVYNLETASATSFLFTAQTTSLAPYVDYYISLLRWYPELNSYRTVEIGKTDDKGQTVMRVKTEDVDYRIGIYESDGTLLTLRNSLKFICQTNPCTYSIYADENELDLTTFTNIQSNLSWNPTTKIFTYIWNDPSQLTQEMNLSVYKITGTGKILICSSASSSYTGVVQCDVSAYTGELVAEVFRTASPPILMSQLTSSIKDLFSDETSGGTLGLLLGALVVIFFAFVGIISPVLVVILGIIALIPLFLIGNISLAVITATAVLGGVVLHFMTRTRT